MKLDENLAAIHAYLCADGYVIKNPATQKVKYYRVGLRNTNLELLKDFQNKFYNYFGVKPNLYEGQRCAIGSKEIYSNLTKNFGSFYSKEWRKPDMSNNLTKIWLRTYFDCEGWVYCKSHQNRHIGVDSINEIGLNQVKEDLEKIGIKIIKKQNTKRKMFRLFIYGRENLELFRKNIGFLHPEKKSKLNVALADYVNYIWQINKLEDVKDIMKERARIKKPYIIRIVSREEINLIKLSKSLIELFDIGISNIHERVNGLGTRYFELSINRLSEVKKAIKHNLINDNEVSKITIR